MESAFVLAKNESARLIETAVEKNRSEQRLERIRQRGRPLAPAIQIFAAAQHQMPAETELPALFGECAAVDQFGARLGQRAFAKRGKFFVELPCEHELQNGIAKKF